MKIAPVRLDPTDSPMDGLIVIRTDPVSGRYDRVRVDQRYIVHVQRPDEPVKSVQLDAKEAEDLVHALAESVSGHSLRDLAPKNALGETTYDIDLRWAGNTYHFAAVTAGADDALHSLIAHIDPLIEKATQTTTMRRSHAQ